jgi:hypothetical protein
MVWTTPLLKESSIPVFRVISLGWVARQKGLIPSSNTTVGSGSIQEYNDADADADTLDAPATSVMNTYLQAIQSCPKYEVLKDTKNEEMWLTEILNQNDWWIRHQQAEPLCKNLDVHFEEIAYYRDIYVWLPEKPWGPVAWSPCPSCLQQNKIGAHGWQKNHYARRVATMNSNYWFMSRRYMCHHCNSKGKGNRETIEGSQESTQIQQASFMGYNPPSRCAAK